MLVQIQFVMAYMQARIALVNKEEGNDRGEILQTTVIIALFVAAAIIIVGILVVKATDAANRVKTQ